MSIEGYTASGLPIPMRGSPEFIYMALRGVIPGITRLVIGGFNSDIDIATVPEDIWGGDGVIPRPAGNEAWEIVGGAADTAAGTGARTVSLTTLDAAYVSTTQTIAMNGATAVPIPGNCRFANIGTVLSTGSDGRPSQSLVIRVAGGGAARAYISQEGVLNQAKFTVPDNFRLELLSTVVGLRTDGAVAESVVFNNVVTNEAGRQLAPLRLPLFSGGVNILRHEVAGGVIPYATIQSRNEVAMRVIPYNLSEFTKTAFLFRMLLRRLPPAEGLKWTERLVNVFFPLHQAIRKHRVMQAILSRLSPVL